MKWEVPPRQMGESGGHRVVQVMSAFPLGLEHCERWADGFEEASSYKYQGAGSDKWGCCPLDFCVTGHHCHGPSSTGCKLCLQWEVENSTSMCCWDCSYLELSCRGGRRNNVPPSPVRIPLVDPDQFHGQLDWSRTKAAAPLCHLDCSLSSLTPCKPSWDWVIQMNSGV